MNKAEFNLDPFQKEAIEALKSGVSVVVSAPTGSGKTAIAEFVIEEAIKNNERVFYTTPLKALTNQKFHDFQKKYGLEKVGILTGDTAINRDAQIIVMTTEIYRNMLYGTAFGSVDDNLKQLRYLVLDECHYMNDPDRGTVWEESIIYSPQKVQILALSATIANAKDLCEWISNVHSETKLIESFHRPVPLAFYYFKDFHLYPLLTTDKHLNPQLKQHKDSFKASKQKFRDLQKTGGEEKGARIPDIVKGLSQKELLSAIYFVFSRKGCEGALKDCQSLGFTLLSPEERKTLSNLIQERTYGNEYLFKHRHLGSLYQGMAVHHAGLLPQWKAIVEELFSKGLIKVVFATETLAAGINMPAKTTVISNLGKRGDGGYKNLSSNDFLQMSGRAGRRGMDKIGNVVIRDTAEYTPAFAAKLATSPPEPLMSRFTPNYSMVLNLLQNHSVDQIKNLLNKSFGQYLMNKNLLKFKEEKHLIKSKMEKTTNYPCPDPNNPGDIKVFRKQDENLHVLERNLSHLEDQNHPELMKYEKQYKAYVLEHESYPCFPCKNKEQCFKMEKDSRKLENKLKETNRLIDENEHFYWNQFLRLANVLNKLGYLENNVPTEKGIMSASLRGENIILISEVLLKCSFQGLKPDEFAACISSLAIDEPRPRTYTKFRPSYMADDVFMSMFKISRNLIKLQREDSLEVPANINPHLAGIIEFWCKPESKWEELLRSTNLDEGDIVRAGRRTMDLLRHIKNASYLRKEIIELAKHAFDLMDKEPIKEVV